MYMVFNQEWEEVAKGEDRVKVVKSLKDIGEGRYTLVKLLQTVTVRPPKRELENVIELGASFNPRKKAPAKPAVAAVASGGGASKK